MVGAASAQQRSPATLPTLLFKHLVVVSVASGSHPGVTTNDVSLQTELVQT